MPSTVESLVDKGLNCGRNGCNIGGMMDATIQVALEVKVLLINPQATHIYQHEPSTTLKSLFICLSILFRWKQKTRILQRSKRHEPMTYPLNQTNNRKFLPNVLHFTKASLYHLLLPHPSKYNSPTFFGTLKVPIVSSKPATNGLELVAKVHKNLHKFSVGCK